MPAVPKLATFTALGALALVACEPPPPPHRAAPRPVPAGAYVEELPPEMPLEAPAIAEPIEPLPGAPEPFPARTVERAAAVDSDQDNDDPVRVRRYAYRVRLAVPESLGADHSAMAVPSAELFVDVSADRLRARFVGPGWPVEAGSEVRLRGDSPGAYLFDRHGGRPLAPGALAEWFEGGPRNRAGPHLAVRRDSAGRGDAPGGLICALLAEWSGEPRENAARRCESGAPLGFRVGLWRAERTADVPVELPRRALRADEVGSPPPIGRSSSRAFLEPSALGRIEPKEEATTPPAPDAPAEGLDIVNESDARVVVTVEGVVIGWVDAGAHGLFVGLKPGIYRVAAVRPLGAVVIRPREVQVPGRTVIGMPRRRATD